MPELPEVETMRRGIAAIVGSRITKAERLQCERKPILVAPDASAFDAHVRGKRIEGVGRLGKRVLIELQGDDTIVLEPRMTGLVLVADPPNQEHLRFRLKLAGGPVKQVLYWDRRGLGSVRLFSSCEFKETFDAKLGPDALAVDSDLLRARLEASRREIKVALLDQRALAGVGNLYASEILHLARIHPQRRCDQLRGRQWVALHEALVEVLEAAIRYEGSTLGDGTYRNALNESGGYQNHHRVYDREEALCLGCGRAKIVRIVQAQRATFFCPRCQKLA